VKLEHTAIQVEDPNAMADWYCQHFYMRVRAKQEQSPFTHFLEDSAGDVLIEFYHNEAHPVPDYPTMEPLFLHFAFVSEAPREDAERLKAAGATYLEEVDRPDGTLLIMMRDPWGLPIQLCRRATPFFPGRASV
jgi:catechol 2,3-dioxygenase-like lactoylglutathione lyase family enzyme